MTVTAAPAKHALTADGGIEVARILPDGRITPLHYECWRDFAENCLGIERAFTGAGLEIVIWEPGVRVGLRSR